MAGSWGTLGVPDRGDLQGAAAAGARRDAGAARPRRRRAVEALCAGLGSPFEVTRRGASAGCGRRRRCAARCSASRVSPTRSTTAPASCSRLLSGFGAAGRRSKARPPPRSGARCATCASLAGRATRPSGASRSRRPRPGRVAAGSPRALRRALVLRLGRRARLDRDRADGRRRRRGDPRRASSGIGGHATLVRAPAEVRAAVAVFEPLPEPLMRIRRHQGGVRSAGVLNPGRMYAGIRRHAGSLERPRRRPHAGQAG